VNASVAMDSLPIIGMARPQFGHDQVAAVQRVLASGNVAQGPEVAQFERDFATYVGAEHGIATANGTVALEAALAALGVGSGDEVITVPFSFFATVSAILRAGATPIFVDISADDFTLDVAQLPNQVTGRTRGIIPVDLFGQMGEIDRILALAAPQGIAVLEDACQAHGAALNGRHAGGLTTAAFSFYATKNLPIGEGGMVTTNDAEFARRCRAFINHGMEEKYIHRSIGTNGRMMDIAAAIGNSMLPQLDAMNAARSRNAEVLRRGLQDTRLRLPKVRAGATHVWHQFTVVVPGEGDNDRNALATYLRERRISTGIHYPIPIHLQPAFAGRYAPGSFPVAEYLADHVLSLPVHSGLTASDLERVVEAVRDWDRA
jgi:perosamine synthetase